MKPFKFFQKKEVLISSPNRMITNELVPVQPINEPQYSHMLGFEVFGVTPIMYDPTTFYPVKCVMYLDTVTQRVVKGETISEGHPLWNYERV